MTGLSFDLAEVLDHEVTVCDECLQASCWQGKFLCDRSYGAGTTTRTACQLGLLELENPEYWFTEPATGAVDRDRLEAFEQFDRTALSEWITP